MGRISLYHVIGVKRGASYTGIMKAPRLWPDLALVWAKERTPGQQVDHKIVVQLWSGPEISCPGVWMPCDLRYGNLFQPDFRAVEHRSEHQIDKNRS